MVLDKKRSLYDRDEKGEIIPKQVELEIDENIVEQQEFKGETIYIIPMTRGEIRKMFAEIDIQRKDAEKDYDGELIVKYVKNPLYNLEDVKFMKPGLTTAIVNTIFRESGLDTSKGRKKGMLKAEDDFAKNS